MPSLEMKGTREKKKILPLIIALLLSTFFDVSAPLSRVSGCYEGMDTEYLFGEG